jgi:hypothetical protein
MEVSRRVKYEVSKRSAVLTRTTNATNALIVVKVVDPNSCGSRYRFEIRHPGSGETLTMRTGWFWWARQDLNLGPTDYESAALTAELQARWVLRS